MAAARPMSPDVTDELRGRLHTKMDDARSQELVRIRQMDTSPIPDMLGGSLDLLVDAFGQLEQRCGGLERDLVSEREARVRAEQEAAAALLTERERLESALQAERERAEAALLAERERSEKEQAERAARLQAERERAEALARKQAERLQAERDQAARDQASRDQAARDQAAREALAQASASGEAPAVDFDALIRTAIDAKLGNLDGTIRDVVMKALAEAKGEEPPPPDDTVGPEETLARQRKLMVKILGRMANVKTWAAWSHWLGLVKQFNKTASKKVTGNLSERCADLSRSLNELRRSKASKDALSEAASQVRASLEAEVLKREKRHEASERELERRQSDLQGYQATTDSRLGEQADRIAALEQQLKDQLEALTSGADEEQLMEAPKDGEAVTAEWAQQLSEMVKKMGVAFKSKFAGLESSVTEHKKGADRGFAQTDEGFGKVDVSLEDLRAKLAALSNNDALAHLKGVLLDRVAAGERDLRARSDHALQRSDAALNAVKTLGYNVSGLEVEQSLVSNFTPIQLEDQDDCVEAALTKRLEASDRCHTEDVLGHVVDLHRGYLEAEAQLAKRARADFVDNLTQIHTSSEDVETDHANLAQKSLRHLDDAFAKARKGRASVLASLFLAKSKTTQKEDWRLLAGTVLQEAPASHYAEITHDGPSAKVATLLESFEREITEQRAALRESLHDASFDPRDPRSSGLEAEADPAPVAHPDLAPLASGLRLKAVVRRVMDLNAPHSKCVVSYKRPADTTVAARLERLEARGSPSVVAAPAVATGGVSNEALRALEAAVATRRHAAGSDTLKLLSGSGTLLLQDALAAFGQRDPGSGATRAALQAATRAAQEAAEALEKGESLEQLWPLAATLSACSDKVPDDVDVRHVHKHLADCLEADLAKRQYANSEKLAKRCAALEDAQHAFQKVLADLGQMEAPQITISSDERPPTPEPVLIQQPAMDPELLEALEKLEFVMPTKAQQSAVDDLSLGLDELRARTASKLGPDEMDALKRLLETKAGSDDLLAILRRLRALEDAPEETFEGLASTKCLSCNRPVSPGEDYLEDEYSVVTGATGATQRLNSPLRLDTALFPRKRPVTGSTPSGRGSLVLRDYPYPPPFPGPFSPPKYKSRLSLSRDQAAEDVALGETPLHEKLAQIGRSSQFLSPVQQAHLTSHRRRKQLQVRGSGSVGGEPPSPFGSRRKMPPLDRRNVVSPDSNGDDVFTVETSYAERPRVRMSSSVAG